jgi:basic amino acid/polyamine antiporter, APA family
MQKQNQPALKRAIGATGLALNAINLTIGAGIFVLPAIVAANLGRAAFIAYLLCGLLVILIMLCYAEIGSKVTTSGGSYAYVEKAFGPFAGFLINTIFWFGFAGLSNAAVINALADMLTTWFPAFGILYIRIIFFIGVYGLLSFINVRGVKEGSHFAAATTFLKLLPLIILIVLGLFSISSDNLVVKTWPSVKNIGESALVLFFAFMGIETALNVSGEIKNPQKNIPKGIFMGVLGVLIIYMLIQLVAQGVLGDGLALHKEAPLASLAIRLIGPVGGTVILITAVISMFGMVSGDVLATPRLLFAASKDKLLPGFLGRIHPKFATPHWSIIIYSAVIVVLASTGGFKQLAILASSSVLLIYLAVVLATIKLRFKKENVENDIENVQLTGTGNTDESIMLQTEKNNKGGFKIAGGLTIPILAVVTISWFLYQIPEAEIKALAIFFIVLTGLYFINFFLIGPGSKKGKH